MDTIEFLRQKANDPARWVTMIEVAVEEIERLRQQVAECEEFLKEGESLRDRMIRFGLDIQKSLMREAKLKIANEDLQKQVAELRSALEKCRDTQVINTTCFQIASRALARTAKEE